VEEEEVEAEVEVEGGNARSVAQRRGGERGRRGQPEPPMDGKFLSARWLAVCCLLKGGQVALEVRVVV